MYTVHRTLYNACYILLIYSDCILYEVHCTAYDLRQKESPVQCTHFKITIRTSCLIKDCVMFNWPQHYIIKEFTLYNTREECNKSYHYIILVSAYLPPFNHRPLNRVFTLDGRLQYL